MFFMVVGVAVDDVIAKYGEVTINGYMVLLVLLESVSIAGEETLCTDGGVKGVYGFIVSFGDVLSGCVEDAIMNECYVFVN